MVIQRAELPSPPSTPSAITSELKRVAERVLERLRVKVARQRWH